MVLRRPRPGTAGASVLEGEPERPTWLTGLARRLWDAKVAIYSERKQSVRGHEGALAQHVLVEADLIARRRRKAEVPVALITAHRWTRRNFSTRRGSEPAPTGSKPLGGNPFANNRNPFAKHGTRPCAS